MTRALILTRLSRVTDATTSPERQREACRRRADEQGMTVVGVAEDLDVSGSVDPMKRAGIGPWLRDRLDDFDVIIAWKLDRIGRNARDMSSLVNFLLDNGKSLATVQDSIDISTPVGRMLVYILATLAEMELASISDRNTASSQYLIANGRWRGGVLPAGYRSVDNPDGAGLVLVPDEEGTAPTVRGIVADVLAGKRLAGIVKSLNDQGAQTQKDRSDVLAGREPGGKDGKPRRWTISNVRRMLASPTLVGRTVVRPVETGTDGKPKLKNGRKVYAKKEQTLYDNDGRPVVRAEPLISESDYDRLRAILAERAEVEPKQRRAAEPSLLLHVLYCGKCGAPLYRLKGGPGRQPRYRCSSTQNGASCGSLSPTQADADNLITLTLLRFFGRAEYVERRRTAGTDTTAQITEVDDQIASLVDTLSLLKVGTPGRAKARERMAALDARRAELDAMPTTAAGWEYVPTGDTFAERWVAMTPAERNDFLRTHSVRAEYVRMTGERPRWDITFGEVAEMLRAIDPGSVVGEGQEEFEQQLRGLGVPLDAMDVERPAYPGQPLPDRVR